jgi:similar to spore coat protein
MADSNGCNNNNQQQNNNNQQQNSQQQNNQQQNNVNSLTPHEIIELHELINSGIVGAKKTKASMEMVQDQELKTFMQESLNAKKTSLEQMQTFINNQPSLK